MKKLLTFLLVFALTYSMGQARAQYSILQSFGVKCINCHYNVQGGGLRNNPGWSSRSEVSLLKPSTIGLGKVFNFLSSKGNTLFGDKVTFGIDFRLQNAKWPAGTVYDTTPNPYSSMSDITEIKGTYAFERHTMPMQLTPYLLVEPVKWLGIEGMLNAAYYIDDRHYPGQQPGAFSVNFRFNDNLPYLRVGYFQPTIGTKYEDHTLMIHRLANGASYARPVKPDDYAEWGAQLDYEKFSWLDLSLGLFQTKNLGGYTVNGYTGKDIANAFAKESLVDTTGLAYVGKVTIIPNPIKNINYFFGGAVYFNGPFGNTDVTKKYFLLTDLFFHLGLTEKFALMTEYIHTSSFRELRTISLLS